MYWKLTDKKGYSYGRVKWGESVSHTAQGKGANLCSADVIHVYNHPYKAALFNPIHAAFREPILWECRVRKVVANDGLKIGVKTCTTIKKVPLPLFTTTQRVAFAILVAKEVNNVPSFVSWANSWLDGTERSAKAAEVATTAVVASYWVATGNTEDAAWATRTAMGATRAATGNTENVAWAAWAAAWTAAEAVEAAPEATTAKIDFVSIAKKVLREY